MRIMSQYAGDNNLRMQFAQICFIASAIYWCFLKVNALLSLLFFIVFRFLILFVLVSLLFWFCCNIVCFNSEWTSYNVICLVLYRISLRQSYITHAVSCTSAVQHALRRYSCMRQLRGCTEIIAKSVNMLKFQNFYHTCLLNECTNKFAAENYCSEKLHSRVLFILKLKNQFLRCVPCFQPLKTGKGSSWVANFWCR